MRPVLVSSCLLGLATRYDGTEKDCPALHHYLQQNDLIAIPVCPEQLAGLPTPRPKCWFVQGDGTTLLLGAGELRDEAGNNVNESFLRGAQQALKLAKLCGCRTAILKQRSPSCGTRRIDRNGQLVDGSGVTAALLKSAGLKLLSEEDLAEEKS